MGFDQSELVALQLFVDAKCAANPEPHGEWTMMQAVIDRALDGKPLSESELEILQAASVLFAAEVL